MHQPEMKIGLVVNQLSGIGGEVGLAGSDGEEIQAEARARGGRSRAPGRAARFARELLRLNPGANIITAAGSLGGDWVAGATILAEPVPAHTTASDTRRIAAALADAGVELIVFVGGDGTARDVLSAVPANQLCLGVPAGVKMHSGVFAVTPEDAAMQASEVLAGRGRSELRDVVDLDEGARRAGMLSTAVYGVMLVPQHTRMQRGKRSPAASGDSAGVADEVQRLYGTELLVFGPGTTIANIERRLGLEPSLLGIDVMEPGGHVHYDVTGAQLEQLVWRESRGKAPQAFTVVLSPVGGQGIVIGRGNHQLTERILNALLPERLVIVAEPAKLGELRGRLSIDAPTQGLNERFRGHCRVLLGAGDTAIARIE